MAKYGETLSKPIHFYKVIIQSCIILYLHLLYFRTITKCVHMSGVGSANKLLTYVQEKWETFPFSAVKVKKYNVTLSYAN